MIRLMLVLAVLALFVIGMETGLIENLIPALYPVGDRMHMYAPVVIIALLIWRKR